jgi:SSU ribosomal protein S13P
VIGLTYIYGIGRTSAKKILAKAGIDENKRISELTDEEANAIRNIIATEYKVEGQARSEQQMAIND